LAKRYHVNPAKIIGWIRTGELTAVNIASRPGQRPRWIITPEQLAAFESLRCSSVTVKPNPIRRRRDRRITEYFQ
jgi:hypothetical protein